MRRILKYLPWIGIIVLILLIIYFVASQKGEDGKESTFINTTSKTFDEKVRSVLAIVGIQSIKRTEYYMDNQLVAMKKEISFNTKENATVYYTKNLDIQRGYGTITYENCGAKKLAVLTEKQGKTYMLLEATDKKYVSYSGPENVKDLMGCPK